MYKSKEILLFGGTYEGRVLSEYLNYNNMPTTVFVATNYGKNALDKLKNITIKSERLDKEQIKILIENNNFNIVIDATHPYAKEVTQNIKWACDETNTDYIRLLREEYKYDNIITVSDIKSCAKLLNQIDGNVLITTGSKELMAFCDIQNYAERFFIRVLPDADVLAHCNKLGFNGKHIIAMQGPFSSDLNIAMLKQFNCKYLVTKNTGESGGLEEKIIAAKQAGATIIMIERPINETGYTLDEVIKMITPKKQFFPLFIDSKNKNVLVVGGGEIATRRIKTLLKFEFNITVVSDCITCELTQIIKNNKICYFNRRFLPDDINNMHIVLAATNECNTNELIGKLANDKNIYVSVADEKQQCNFYFPGVVIQDELIIGVTSDGKSHKAVKDIVKKLGGFYETQDR